MAGNSDSKNNDQENNGRFVGLLNDLQEKREFGGCLRAAISLFPNLVIGPCGCLTGIETLFMNKEEYRN